MLNAQIHLAGLQIPAMHLARFWACHCCAVAPARTRLSSLHSICDILWQVSSASPTTQNPAANSAQQLRTTGATSGPAGPYQLACCSCFLHFVLLYAVQFSACRPLPPAFSHAAHPAVPTALCPPRPATQPPLPPPSLEGHPHRRLAPGSVRTPALHLHTKCLFMDANYN